MCFAGAIATSNVLSAQLSSAISQTEYGRKLQDKSGPRVEAAKTVARSTIGAALKVFEALEVAGKALLVGTANATVTVVTHKYGQEVGAATQQGFGVVTDLTDSALAMRKVGVRAIAKATVREAALDVTSSEEENAARRAARAARHSGTDTLAVITAASQLSSLAQAAPVVAALPASQIHSNNVSPPPSYEDSKGHMHVD